MDQIDGIFCADQLAKELIERHLPKFPSEKILATGTPGLGSLEQGKADFYRQGTRKKLDLPENAFVVLYLGDVNNDYPLSEGFDEHINEKTFELTQRAVYDFASEHADRQIGFLFRWHPRDPQRELLADKLVTVRGTANIKSALAIGPEISINQAAYAADVITSIISTENMYAPHRGRQAVFLGYQGPDFPGLGGKALENAFGSESMCEIPRIPGLGIASSPAQLESLLESMMVKSGSLKANNLEVNYPRRILDKILAS